MDELQKLRGGLLEAKALAPPLALRAALCAVAAAAVILGASSPTSADDTGPKSVMYQGTPGSALPVQVGVIRVTFTPDRSGVIRVTAGEGPFSSSLNSNRQMYYEPPAPVSGGAFSVGIPLNLVGTLRAGLIVEGTFQSDTQITGRVRYAICGTIPCQFWDADMTLTGPLDTPPAPDDLPLAGSLAGDPGGISLWRSPDGTEVTALAFRGGALTPCIDAGDEGTVHWFFAPGSVAISPEGEFSASTFLIAGVQTISLYVKGTVQGPSSASGTLGCLAVYSPEIAVELAWAAPAVGPVGGIAGLPDVAGSERSATGDRLGAVAWYALPVLAGLGAVLAARRLLRR
jgi:hypothetical protein